MNFKEFHVSVILTNPTEARVLSACSTKNRNSKFRILTRLNNLPELTRCPLLQNCAVWFNKTSSFPVSTFLKSSLFLARLKFKTQKCTSMTVQLLHHLSWAISATWRQPPRHLSTSIRSQGLLHHFRNMRETYQQHQVCF